MVNYSRTRREFFRRKQAQRIVEELIEEEKRMVRNKEVTAIYDYHVRLFEEEYNRNLDKEFGIPSPEEHYSLIG